MPENRGARAKKRFPFRRFCAKITTSCRFPQRGPAALPSLFFAFSMSELNAQPSAATPAPAAPPKPSLLWLAIDAYAWLVLEGLLDSELKFDPAEQHPASYTLAPVGLLKHLFDRGEIGSHRVESKKINELALRLVAMGASFRAPVLEDTRWMHRREDASPLVRAFKANRWEFLDGLVDKGHATGPEILAELLAHDSSLPGFAQQSDSVEALTRLLNWGLDPNGKSASGAHWVCGVRTPEALAAFQAAGADLAQAVDAKGRTLPEIIATLPKARERSAMFSAVLKAVKAAQGASPKPLAGPRVIMPGEEPAAIDESPAATRIHETLNSVARVGGARDLKSACAVAGTDAIHYRTPQGESLLEMCLTAANFPAARWLIGQGAKILPPGFDGQPALMRALWTRIEHSHSRAKQVRGQVAKRLAFFEELPALCAAENFSWAALDAKGRNWLGRALCADTQQARAKISPSLRDTPLDVGVVGFLISHGSDVNHRDHDGLCPLELAADAELSDIYMSTLSRGLRWNRLDKRGLPLVARAITRSDFYSPTPVDRLYEKNRQWSHCRALVDEFKKELLNLGPQRPDAQPAWPLLSDGQAPGPAVIGLLAKRFEQETAARTSSHRSDQTESLDLAAQIHALLSLGLPSLAVGADKMALWDAWALWMFPNDAEAGEAAPASRLAPRKSMFGARSILTVARKNSAEDFIWALGSLVAAGFSLRQFDLPAKEGRPRDFFSWEDSAPKFSSALAALFEGSGVRDIHEALGRLSIEHPFFSSQHPRHAKSRQLLVEKEGGAYYNQLENAALLIAVPDGQKKAEPKKAHRL